MQCQGVVKAQTSCAYTATWSAHPSGQRLDGRKKSTLFLSFKT